MATCQAVSSTTAAGVANDLVQELREARVAVMSIPVCPYCKRAKEALFTANIAYVDVDVSIDPALREVVRDLTGKRTVPQIFVGGRSLGGSDDLLAQMADGTFQQLLAAECPPAPAGGSGAVPAELLAAVGAALQRKAAAGEAASASSGSDPAHQRLREVAARLAMPPAQGGIPRTDSAIGDRTFRVFTLDQLRTWLDANLVGTADATSGSSETVRQLLDANLVVPAAEERQEADRQATAAAAATAASCGSAAAAVTGAAAHGVLTLATEAPVRAVGKPLNTQFWWQGPARPASEVATSLRQLILELYDKHLSADGRSVSYGAIRSDPRFTEFVAATAELQKVDLSPLSREELISLGINLYNALIIHTLVALGLTRMSAAQRATFFSRTAKYNIGGQEYSADDLENGVLRGNRAGAANVWNLLGLHGMAGGQFANGDPRLAQVVSPVDPRIHFALVCGAKSCPPIKLYSAANLEEGLAAAAEAFCAGEVAVDPSKREVRLSKIFKWYAIDFGANKYERLSTISSYLTEPAKGQLQALVAAARAGGKDVRVGYKEYDWSLNGTN